MKRHAFAKLTASRGFRALTCTLVFVMVADVPARAFAQAASGQPIAAAQSSTATKLADVPDSIPYEANPYPQVAQTRTMSTQIKQALENAGIDPTWGSPSYDETPAADTVTFEGQYPDGDIIVTGKLVNGRIALTKQFKPLLPSGDGVGAAVTIAYNPTPATAGATASAAPDITGRGSIEAKRSPAQPAGAPPLPDEVIRKANLELEQHYRAEAAKIEGPFVVTGPGSTMGTTKDVPASLPVIIGLLIVRDLYYTMLMAYARNLRKLKRLPDEEKKALVEKLIAAAPRLNAEYKALTLEERRARMMERAHYYTSYARYSSSAEYWERKGDFEQAAFYRKKADETRWGQYLQSRATFVELLGENTEHQLLSLFRDTWAPGDEAFLFEIFAEPPESTEERIAAFDEFLTVNYTDLENEAADAKAVHTFSKLKQFLEPKYDRVREAAQMVTASTGVNLPGQSVDALGDIYQSVTSANVAKQVATDVVIGVALLIALVFLPVLGAVLNAGYAGFQVVKEGNELRIAWTRVDEAKRTAGVTGQEQVFTEEDKQQAQLEKFFITAGAAISEVKVGVDAAPLLRQRASRLRERLNRTASRSTTSGRAADAAGAAPGATATAPPTGRGAAPAAQPQGVDRAATTQIDLPATRADAANIAAARQQVGQEIDQIDRQLATAAPADRVGLQRQRQELQTRLGRLDEEQRHLNALIAQGEVDRAAVTIADPNALREEFADLSKRQNALENELAGASARAMRDPKLKAQEQALEKQLDAIQAERKALSARIDQAEKDALQNLTVEQAQQRTLDLYAQSEQLRERMNVLVKQIDDTPDAVKKAALQKQFDEADAQLEKIRLEYRVVKPLAMRELDAEAAEIAREALDEEIRLALEGGIPKARVDELTKGYVPGQTADLEQLGLMTDRLFDARLTRPILDFSNPADQDAIALALEAASLIRGGLATARKTGRLPDELQEYLAEKGGIQYIDTLYDRYFRGGGPKGKLDERYPIVQNELLDELKTYVKPAASGAPLAAAAQKAAETAKAAAQRPTDQSPSPNTTRRNQIRERQQDAATRALLGGTSLAGEMPGPPMTGPVGSSPAEEVAILDKHIVANAVRLSQLIPRAFGGGTAAADAEAAQDEFFIIDLRQRAILRERRLLVRDEAGAIAGEGTKTSAPGAPASGASPAGAPGGEGTKPSVPGAPATGSPPTGTGAAAPSTPREGALAPPASGKPPGSGGAGTSGTGVVFADSIPEGPGFAITGAEKPKKDDAPSTAVSVPMVIRLDGDNSYTFNPAIINTGVRLVLVQYTGAEGQEMTVPGASEPAKGPDLARAPRRWNPRSILENLAGLFAPPAILANWRGEPTAVARPPAVQRQGNPANASPIKIVLTSLGRSSGDAFEMTVFNTGPAPVRLTGDAFVLEPVADVTRATVDRELAQMGGAGRATATLKAYCLEFLKRPPAVGMLFRLAPEGVQRRFGNFGRIFEASRKLRDQGKLQPGPGDPSNPASYFDDVRQWAIWTQEQAFDEKGYTRAFTEHSRKNVEAAGHTWTRELEKAFTGLASGRWQAVQMVLREAAAR